MNKLNDVLKNDSWKEKHTKTGMYPVKAIRIKMNKLTQMTNL